MGKRSLSLSEWVWMGVKESQERVKLKAGRNV